MLRHQVHVLAPDLEPRPPWVIGEFYISGVGVALGYWRDGERRLVAYVVPREEARPSLEALRVHLEARLPEYMVPAAFISLAALPLSANGKVDRARLPAPERIGSGVSASDAPRTETEALLQRIWQDVLGVPVGIRDNFFELGGDSILGIQVLAHAARAGVRLTARQILERPILAELAQVARPELPGLPSQSHEEPEALLTPMQRWFFEQGFAQPHHWNQAVIVALRQEVELRHLERALGRLVERHGALRSRFERRGSEWVQRVVPWEGTVAFDVVDLRGLSEDEARTRRLALTEERQANLSLEQGPLLRVTLFQQAPPLLLFVIHHLVVDGISWRVLLEELELLLSSTEPGPASVSFSRATERLQAYARSQEVAAAADWWLQLPWSQVAPLPVDNPGGDNTVASARRLVTTLSAEETEALLRRTSARVDEVLLTALVHALTEWTGGAAALIDLESHGREAIFEDLDVSRTVGWFTALHPVVLTRKGTLASIQEQLRRVPRRGLPYGLLRYMRSDAELASRLAALPEAQISFDYLGQVDAVVRGSRWFQWSQESTGTTRSPRGQRRDLIEVLAIIAEGRLRVTWVYSEAVHRPETLKRLARSFSEALQELLSPCPSRGRSVFTR